MAAIDDLLEAINKVGHGDSLSKEIIEEACKNNPEKKTKAINQWIKDNQAKYDKTHEELGGEYQFTWDWWMMPKEKMLEILTEK